MDTNGIVLLLIAVMYFLLNGVGLWKLFQRAGRPGWAAFIPIYGQIVWLDIIGKPRWWIVLLLIPVIDIIVAIGMMVELMKSFGKNRLIEHILAVTFPVVYLPYLGFVEKPEYLGPASQLPKVKKSQTREWADAIIFAVMAATIIRWGLVEAFTIPTPSMEKSLLVGDFLFVSKFHYGPRTPKTPLQLPLTHQKIWGTDMDSYLSWIQLPQYRLPGFSEVKHNDVVVFNYPPEDQYPVDLRTNYIKRCIGLPGDSLKIVKMQVFVNGKANENPPLMQHSYFVETTGEISDHTFRRLDITEVSPRQKDGYALITFHDNIARLKEVDVVKNIHVGLETESSERVFPFSKHYSWNKDNYGAIYIPKKGVTVNIDEFSLPLYEKVILEYDGNENAELKDNKIFIDGKPITQYTFKQNYYFMMGDNRHNSLDSRFWGFVPEDHILGKAVMIWWSVDPEGGLGKIFSRIRWKRLGQFIE